MNISAETRVQPFKTTEAARVQLSQNVFCKNCDEHVGYFLPGYNCSETGTLVQYKMIIVSQHGNQKMLWSGETPKGDLHPAKWRSDKRIVEERSAQYLSSKGKYSKAEMEHWTIKDFASSFSALSLHAELMFAQKQKEEAEQKCRELETKLEDALCQVCCERNVDILLQCGHRICRDCRDGQIRLGRSSCPWCRRECPQATDRKMY